jgi:Sigma-70 region 2
MPAIEHQTPRLGSSSDLELVEAALARDGEAFRTIMRTHNQRLYRIARGILRNDSEAEDVVQEAYVNAFAHLDTFRGDSALATWLSRIVMNEALGRLRRSRNAGTFPASPEIAPKAEVIRFPLNSNSDGRVEVWRVGVRLNISVGRPFRLTVPYWFSRSSVSTPRSSNRTCRSPASGSRTRTHAFTHDTPRPSWVRRTSPKCW